MTQTTTQTPQPQDPAGAEIDAVDEQVAARLVEQAREQCAAWYGGTGTSRDASAEEETPGYVPSRRLFDVLGL